MTRVNIISRYFDSADTAKKARYELVYGRRLSHRIVDYYDSAEGLADKLVQTHVDTAAAQAYETRVKDGGAVSVVRAEYKPLGVARITREVLDDMGAADMGQTVQEVLHRGPPRKQTISILQDHPHLLTRRRDPMSTNYHMADWPLPLTIRTRRTQGRVIRPHARMTDAFFPTILRRDPFRGSIFGPHARIANFPIPLLSTRKPFTGSIFAPHARMANFPLPLISRRKPYTGSLFPRHQRMATVPFPLLINEKTGKNALIPGAPRMANFPIGLLSDRKPFTGAMIAPHARMANFPIGLISKRKPFTGSIVPRHGRMANMILPLVIRRSNTAASRGGTGFSFSKMLGLPTLIRR